MLFRMLNQDLNLFRPFYSDIPLICLYLCHSEKR